VWYLGSSVRVKFTVTVFGLKLLQEPPPPVHSDAENVTTVVAVLVLTV
jgi:hypothetical protein